MSHSNEIPRVIHYCWFGKHEIPAQYIEYIKSWKEKCPEFEIIEWNESNFNVEENQYCKEAYQAKRWAFVSDYARLKIIYDYGGIYLDTDIELLKPLNGLLMGEKGFIGFQNCEQVTTGLGFAAAPKNPCVKKMLEMYNEQHFIKTVNKIDLTPCPVRNTVALKKCGLKTGEKASRIIQELNGLSVYPVDYFNPMDRNTGLLNITDNTYMIHHYAGTWLTKSQVKHQKIKKLLPKWILSEREKLISKIAVDQMEKIYGK